MLNDVAMSSEVAMHGQGRLGFSTFPKSKVNKLTANEAWPGFLAAD